jgi:hypothetical protein
MILGDRLQQALPAGAESVTFAGSHKDGIVVIVPRPLHEVLADLGHFPWTWEMRGDSRVIPGSRPR